jgi:hypothetical protein
MKTDSLLKGNLPKVSIVIPVYNGANYLAEAIRSALAQTYKNLEVIVVNDGSNDNGETERVAQSFGTAIRYFVKPNGGVASALNFATREMSGDYFSWLSHDDLYCKEKIALQVDALVTANFGEIVLYSDYSIFTDDPDDAVPVKMQGVPPENFRYWITTQSDLHGCTLLIPRFVLEEYGGFNENLRTTQDYDLWFRLAEKYRFVHIPDVLVKARSHSNQGSVNMASVAFKESSELFLGFIRNLTIEEITSGKGQPIGSAYLTLASCMWRRGFRQPGIYASRLAHQYGVTQFRIYLAMFTAYFKNCIVQFLRLMLTPRSRHILRATWGRIIHFK